MRVSGSEGDDSFELMVEYKGHNKFSVFHKENRTDKEVRPIVEDIEIKVNPENDGEVILRSNECQFKMGYLVKSENDARAGLEGNKSERIVLLNSEGQ